MIPVIALVGRPNVGKSTLFNRLTRSRDALVADLPGLTRDRQYGTARLEGRQFLLIDTGGLSGEEQGIDAAMAEQSLQAVAEADLVCLLVDAKTGLTPADEILARQLRARSKALVLVANKIDGRDAPSATAEFHSLGIDPVYAVSAAHGHGVQSLLVAFGERFAPDTEAPAAAVNPDSIRIAIAGRPNVGKSTLVNRLLGEQRVVVFDQPGTTRDSIYIDYSRNERAYTLIDTAGVRRRKNVRDVIEKFSIVKTLAAIADAQVVVLLIDASEGLVEQDMHLLGLVVDAGRALVVAVNKWDGLDADQRRSVRRELDRRLQFVEFADVHFISALHGTGVGHLYASIHRAHAAATAKMSTRRLTDILARAVAEHQPPMVNGRRIKLRMAHPGGSNPPLIVVHGNQTGKLPAGYQRYLEKVYRRELDLAGTPVRVEFRTGENPYAGKRNQLTERQAQRRRRLMQHVKKKKK